DRIKGIESGELKVVGVNAYTQTEESPLGAGNDAIQTVDPMVERQQVEALKAWRNRRDNGAVSDCLSALKAAASGGQNIMEPSIAAAKAGVTTGEWGTALREVFGEYRGPTGVALSIETGGDEDIEKAKARVEALSEKLGRKLTYVLGKPGLDGHSNGAEQIASRARACGMKVIYEGIRFTPSEIVAQAKEADAHVLALSILSGSHLDLVRDVLAEMQKEGIDDVPLVVGGIIPYEDEQALRQMGVRRVYTPKDFMITEIIDDVVDVVEARWLETV
ncbi:MAG: methylmalonyl-CoA mutase family protein, partial [Pseudomonadota bacterium]